MNVENIPYIMGQIDSLEAGEMRAFFVSHTGQVGLSIRAEIKAEGVLKSVCGYGDTLDDAARDLWQQLTDIPNPSEYLVVNVGREDRRALRWNGFAFKAVYEPKREQVSA